MCNTQDWNRRDEKEDYPKAPIVFVDIPLWDKNKTEEYIKERIRDTKRLRLALI